MSWTKRWQNVLLYTIGFHVFIHVLCVIRCRPLNDAGPRVVGQETECRDRVNPRPSAGLRWSQQELDLNSYQLHSWEAPGWFSHIFVHGRPLVFPCLSASCIKLRLKNFDLKLYSANPSYKSIVRENSYSCFSHLTFVLPFSHIFVQGRLLVFPYLSVSCIKLRLKNFDLKLYSAIKRRWTK